MNPPKKWKLVIVIWLAIYPLITIVFLLFGKYLAMIEPLPLRTLAMTIILVPTMVFVMMPAIQKLLVNWLQK
jgi:antibiotic biosynthesis monooxygenase (ABM) superfamily enzyme